MGTDSAFFVAGLVGLLAGYIVGDFQRELRWRRDARRNLARSLEPVSVDSDTVPHAVTVLRTGFDNFPVLSTNGNGDGDRDGPAWSLGSVRDGQARRSAIPGDNNRARAASRVRGGDVRRPAPASVKAGYDCG